MNRMMICGLLLLSGSGCLINTYTGVIGNGVKKTEERKVGAFETVSFTGQGTYRLAPGAAESLKVSGDENLLPFLVTETKGKELNIGMEPGSYSWKVSPQAEVTFQTLKGIKAQGQSTIEGTALDGESVRVDLDGQSTVSLSGKVGEQVVSINGQTNYKAADLVSKKVKVVCNGQATVIVHATEEIEVDANGMCTVEIYGKPAKKNIRKQGLSKVVEK